MNGIRRELSGVAGPGVSVVLISFNEEKRIGACLESVRWADEIIVVDSGSSDATREIARRYTDLVFEIPWQGFGPQKQSAVDRASHRWVLNVDCDEQVTEELATEIRKIVGLGSGPPAYSVPRKTYVGAKWIRHADWYPDATIRLFEKAKGRFSASLVHERVVVEGEVGRCTGHLLHHSFEGVADLFRKVAPYSEASARQMFQEGRGCGYPELVVRPVLAFLKSYVWRLGLLDGWEGLAIGASTFAAVQRKYSRLRELRKLG
jgi:(heptosyl)LPS beta-1,4-glucosyltransferase